MGGIHESLALEIKQFGIRVSIVEPGAYATEFGSPESLKFAPNLDIYTDFKQQFISGLMNLKRGDPHATPEAMFALVDAAEPPLRFFLGNNLPGMRVVYEDRLTTWEKWETVSAAAEGN